MMPATMDDDLLRSALRVSAVSAVWTLAASAAAIVIGLAGHAIALVAFGAVGILDAAASVALVAHFRDVRGGGTAERLERIALHVVTAGLVTVGVATAVVSVSRLLDRRATVSSAASVVLAAVSALALAVLSWRKRHVSARLASHALRADSHLSAVGAVLAAVTLAGTAASSSLGWWWADPVAALAIAVGAVGLGWTMRREP
jgi:divalent metal cation (Fe/Co/Zn/Cd) transporter